MNTSTNGDPHYDLVAGCLRGERRAQAELYQQYARGMYNVCLRMLRHTQDAEDVLQVAFVDIFRKLDSFRFESTVGAWIKRIVVNNCINHLKARRLLTEELQAHHSDFSADEPNSAEPPYTVEGIQQAVSQLPDGYRVVLTLYLFEGYDHEEIGEILNVSSSTSKSQYSRARRKLRAIMCQA